MIECGPNICVAQGRQFYRMGIVSVSIMWVVLRWRCLVWRRLLQHCSGSLSTCSSDQLCPAVQYMTCWEKLEAMSDDSYDSYEGADGQPGYFYYYDDPQDYEEWCHWNDVEEDEGYYAPFPPNVEGGDFFSGR